MVTLTMHTIAVIQLLISPTETGPIEIMPWGRVMHFHQRPVLLACMPQKFQYLFLRTSVGGGHASRLGGITPREILNITDI